MERRPWAYPDPRRSWLERNGWFTSAAWPELIKQASRQAHEGIRTAHGEFGERWEPSKDS